MKKANISNALKKIDSKYLDEAALYDGAGSKRKSKIAVISVAAALAIAVTAVGGAFAVSKMSTIYPVVSDYESISKIKAVKNLWETDGLSVTSIINGESAASAYLSNAGDGDLKAVKSLRSTIALPTAAMMIGSGLPMAYLSNAKDIKNFYKSSTYTMPGGETLNVESTIGDRYVVCSNEKNEYVVYDIKEGSEINLLKRLLGDGYIPYDTYYSLALDYCEKNYPYALLTEKNREMFDAWCKYVYTQPIDGDKYFPSYQEPDMNDELEYKLKELWYNKWNMRTPFCFLTDECYDAAYSQLYPRYPEHDAPDDNNEELLFELALKYADENYPGLLSSKNNRSFFTALCRARRLGEMANNVYAPDCSPEMADALQEYTIDPSDVSSVRRTYSTAVNMTIYEVLENNAVGSIIEEIFETAQYDYDNIETDMQKIYDLTLAMTKERYPSLLVTENDRLYFDYVCRKEIMGYILCNWYTDDDKNIQKYILPRVDPVNIGYTFTNILTQECINYAFEKLGVLDAVYSSNCSFTGSILAFDRNNGYFIAEIPDSEFEGSMKTVIYDIKKDTVTDVGERDLFTSFTDLTDGFRTCFSSDGSFVILTYTPTAGAEARELGSSALNPDYDATYDVFYCGDYVEVLYTDGSGGFLISDIVTYDSSAFYYDDLLCAEEYDINYVRRACSEARLSPTEGVVYYKVVPYEAYPRNIGIKGSEWLNRFDLYNSDSDRWAFYTLSSGGKQHFDESSYHVFTGNLVKFICNDSAVVMERGGKYFIYSLKDGKDITDSFFRSGLKISAHDLLAVYGKDGSLWRQLITADVEPEEITKSDSFILTPDGAFAFAYSKDNTYIECINIATLDAAVIELEPALLESLRESGGDLNMLYDASVKTLTLSLRTDTGNTGREKINFIEVMKQIPYVAEYPSKAVSRSSIPIRIYLDDWLRDHSAFDVYRDSDEYEIYDRTPEFPGYPDYNKN